MKKVFFLFACLSVFALSAQAQKACTKSKAACASKMKMAQGSATIDDAVVAKAASLDEAIERKVCAKSGAVSYHMNYVCSETGKMTSKPVTYDAGSAKFVNMSPSGSMQSTKKACCAPGAKKVSGKKACCAGKKACSKSAAKVNSAATKVEKKAVKVSSSSMQ